MSANEAQNPKPVYVYGVVPAGTRLALDEPGVAGSSVELVERGDLAAVVSDFPADDARVRRRDLHAHLRTLERVFDASTVAPCSFGMVLGSRRDVEEQFLAPRSDELQRLLARLDGRVQMNVKAEYDEAAVLRTIVAGDPDVAAVRDRAKALGSAAYYENIRLGELVSERLEARRERDREEIAGTLAPLAVDFAPDRSGGELVAFKGAFLVDRDRLESFDEALGELAAARADDVRFESIGPLPPTAFATLEPEGAWA